MQRKTQLREANGIDTRIVLAHTGERGAVGSNTGPSVSHSDPGLRRPTSPATVGRKPAARPPISQPKSGRGAGQGSAIQSRREAGVPSERSSLGWEAPGSFSASAAREAGALNASDLESLDEYSIRQLIEFFQILHRWDREAHGNQTM